MKKALVLAVLMFAVLSCRTKREALVAPAEAPPAPEQPRKIGLALGGGAARGFAHIGVLRVFEQEKIPVSVVAGTSVGSVIGALYCDTGRVVDLEYHAMTIDNGDLFDYNLFSVLSGGLIKGDKLEAFMVRNLRHSVLEDMEVPLVVVATDLRTGERVGFDKGSVAVAVHASSAIPGLFQPVQVGKDLYVDGGVSDPIPVDFAREKGADIVVAVAIPPDIPAAPPQKTSEIIRHSLAVMFSKMAESSLVDADVVIRPKCGEVRFNDFTRRKELIIAGEDAAREALPKIRALMEGRPL